MNSRFRVRHGEDGYPISRFITHQAMTLGLSRRDLACRLGYQKISNGHRALAEALTTGKVPIHMWRHLGQALEIEQAVLDAVMELTARQHRDEAAVQCLVSFMPVINVGAAASGGSAGAATGSAPLAARSAIRPLTWSGDIDGGNCNTTVVPACSAAPPAGGAQIRNNRARAMGRVGIMEYLSGYVPITRLPGRLAWRRPTIPCRVVLTGGRRKKPGSPCSCYRRA